MNPTLRCFGSFETLQIFTIFKAFNKISCFQFHKKGVLLDQKEVVN